MTTKDNTQELKSPGGIGHPDKVHPERKDRAQTEPA